MTLRAELDKLAAAIAKDAAQDATPLQEKMDAIKALTPYYALTQKLKGKADDSEDDGATFDAFSTEIANAQEVPKNGRKAVRNRQ
jgi:hypothetical protein